MEAVLAKIGFREVVERWCGDGGDAPVSKVLETLVQSRIACEKTLPLSEVETWVCKTILPLRLEVPASKLNEYRCGRVLELASPCLAAMWLDLLANAHKAYAFDSSQLIYDITSIHVEGEYSKSDYMAYGYSRDGKPDTKQINLGINVTREDGIPLTYATFPGNVNDTSTVADNMQLIKKACEALGIKGRVVVFGDRAMLTPELMFKYRDCQLDFIGAMASSKRQEAIIRDVPDELLMLHPLKYVPKRFQGKSADALEDESYFGYRMPTRITITEDEAEDTGDTEAAVLTGDTEAAVDTDDTEACGDDDVKGTTTEQSKATKAKTKVTRHLVCSALVVLASGKRRLDSQHRESDLKKCEARLAEISGHLNKGQYKKSEYAARMVEKAVNKRVKGLVSAAVAEDATGHLTLTCSRCAEAIKKASFLDGKYMVYFLDSTKTRDEVFDAFKDRDLVERRIGDIKNRVSMRPIYLQNDDRILSSIFVTMVGLLVSTLAERELRRNDIVVTLKDIQEIFSGYNGSLHVFEDYSQVVTMPTGNKWQRRLLRVFDVRLPAAAAVLIPDAFLSEATASTPQPWRSKCRAPNCLTADAPSP